MAFELDAQGDPTLKTATFVGLICVLSRKTSKKWVLWGLQVFTKTLRIFFYDSDEAQTHLLAAQLDAPGAAAFKKDNFMENKFAFRAKKRQKNGFFGVFRSALKRFGILLFDSDDAQIYSMAFELDEQGDPTLKAATLFRINCVSGQKTPKKWVSWGLQVCTKTLRIFTV